jgi:hypothetical protein
MPYSGLLRHLFDPYDKKIRTPNKFNYYNITPSSKAAAFLADVNDNYDSLH